MPTPWSMVDAAFPTFAEGEDVEARVAKICEYMYLLVEELKYQLSNLNSRNFNSNALTTLKTETTADVEAGLEQAAEQLSLVISQVKGIDDRLRGLEALRGQVEQLKTDADNLTLKQEDMNDTLEELTGTVRTDGSGGATIGNDGQELHLVGRVYINGVLIE